MEDRDAIDASLKIDKFFPPFFSVLLPELGRPNYLAKCLDSIHKHADMPIEVIVHDDGSGMDKQREIITHSDKISTLILNLGHNTGLARSLNRCKQMASSSYLIGFNTDTYMTSPFLSNMKAALDLPYVGVVNVTPSIAEGPGVHITSNGVKIELVSRMLSCHAFAIRGETWDEVGGWNEQVQTTSSDGGFIGRLFSKGYFSVKVEGTVFNEMWANDGRINISGANTDYISAADFCRDDINVPPIFKMSTDDHDSICRDRWEAIYNGVNKYRIEDPYFASWHSDHFAGQEFLKLFRNSNVQDIDWDFAETYGHAKWKDRIIEDFNL